VTIGNPGNPGDTRPEANPVGSGAVNYEYQIGKYEVTNEQWNTFVSMAGAPTGNQSTAYDNSAYFTGAQQPTSNVSWYEALQFCNYLTSGDKSKGAYLWSGNNGNPGDFLGIDRDTAVSTYGIVYVIPTEDEWYKAAYYSSSGYSTYANGTSLAPLTTEACYDIYSSPWNVGSGILEQNGTYDMMGNVWEWNESESTVFSGSYLRRSGCYDGRYNYMKSNGMSITFPENEDNDMGFRIASIPEPATIFMLGLGGLVILKKSRT
jgi:formylglycine-generating enzyme required for sulfatase activity